MALFFNSSPQNLADWYKQEQPKSNPPNDNDDAIVDTTPPLCLFSWLKKNIWSKSSPPHNKKVGTLRNRDVWRTGLWILNYAKSSVALRLFFSVDYNADLWFIIMKCNAGVRGQERSDHGQLKNNKRVSLWIQCLKLSETEKEWGKGNGVHEHLS